MPFVKCLSGLAEVPYQVPPWSLPDAPRTPKNKSKEAHLVPAPKARLYRKVLVSGRAQGDKSKGTNRAFSQIFADFCRFSPFPRKQSIWETQIFAENRLGPGFRRAHFSQIFIFEKSWSKCKHAFQPEDVTVDAHMLSLSVSS